MKILNYSTWCLFFSTLMQAILGYTCPNTSSINTKITENGIMRFPLAEGGIEPDQAFFCVIEAIIIKLKDFIRERVR